MSSERPVTEEFEKFVPAAPDDLVSFSIVGRPKPGVSLDELLDRLTLSTLSEYTAPESTLTHVKHQLRSLGFEVFNLPSPVVSARGPVNLFEKEFACTLTNMIRTTTKGDSTHTVQAIVLAPDSSEPSPDRIDGALLIAVVAPPQLAVPKTPPVSNNFSLHLPGDIAQLTGASATHRLTTPLGERATGSGVRVAVIDTGFAPHPYFDQHGYKITRLAAPDTHSPDVDAQRHGTKVIAALLACAPDVEAIGIKGGNNDVLAIDLAMTLPGLRAISLSWVHNLVGKKTLPHRLIPLWVRILVTIGTGVPVIAAAGNGQTSFPAMMPEVIAVGGAAIDVDD